MTKAALLTKRKPILICLRLLGALLLVAVALAPKAGLAGGGSQHLFYTLSGANPAAEELWAIQLSGSKITTTEIGPLSTGGCASLALSPITGKLYSMCSVNPSTFPLGDMRLVTMAMAFAPDGTLYAVGGCVPYLAPPLQHPRL